MPSITLTLPEQMLEQVQQAAAVLQRPVEDVVGALLGAVLPSLHDVPEAVRADLLRMTWLPNQDLWALAEAQMSLPAQEHLCQLTQLQAQRALTAAEQASLEGLRQDYGQTTLRKARAYTLLSLRGGAPLLSEV